eukprot:14441267-Ditylum_brightwellii.AAC.1
MAKILLLMEGLQIKQQEWSSQLDNIITRYKRDNDLEHNADEEKEVSLCVLVQFLLDIMTLEEEKHQRSLKRT